MKLNSLVIVDNEKLKTAPLVKDEDQKKRRFWRKSLKIQFVTGLCLSFFLVVSVFILTMFVVARVKSLEIEVEKLRHTVNAVKNLEQDLISTIIGFENGDFYPDDAELDHEADLETDLLLSKPEDYDDYESKLEFDKTNSSEAIAQQYESPFNLTKDFKETIREKRNIVATTQDGISVHADSNLQSRNTGSKQRTQQNSLITSIPARPSAFGSPWSVYSDSYRNTPEISTTTTPSPVHIRKSRVMHTEDSSKSFRRVNKKPILKSADSGMGSDELESTSSGFTVIRNRYRNRNSNLEVLDEGHPRVGRIKPLPSIHYSGDTSRYVLGQHINFNGNGHLRHPQRTFVDWKASNWVETSGMDAYFSMEEGIVTVKESGLYYVYAQIYYLDEHDAVGYRVYKNADIILQCTITHHSSSRRLKGNTCHTSGVEYFTDGDTVSLADITEGKYSLFEPGKSFFGLIKLGDVKLR